MIGKSPEDRIRRLEDIHEIQNLMGRYEYYHTADMQEETVELFAKKTPGVRVEMMWGVYDGFEGIKRCYIGFHRQGGVKARIGGMGMHTLTTPVIEIAGDGKTAKGVWISPGHETHTFGEKPQAYWAWCKYGCDFVKEDGEWKIWHMHVYGIFHAPYEKSWTDIPPAVWQVPSGATKDVLPDRDPTTYWMYSPTSVTENVPAPPEPYETFDEETAY